MQAVVKFLWILCFVTFLVFAIMWVVEMVTYGCLPELVATRESINIHRMQLDRVEEQMTPIFISLFGMIIFTVIYKSFDNYDNKGT